MFIMYTLAVGVFRSKNSAHFEYFFDSGMWVFDIFILTLYEIGMFWNYFQRNLYLMIWKATAEWWHVMRWESCGVMHYYNTPCHGVKLPGQRWTRASGSSRPVGCPASRIWDFFGGGQCLYSTLKWGDLKAEGNVTERQTTVSRFCTFLYPLLSMYIETGTNKQNPTKCITTLKVI